MPRSGKTLVAPGALDCNRGDQSLVWEAIRCVAKARPGCELAIMADCYDDPDDPQTCQTRKLGVAVLPMLLPNPRRAATPGKDEVIDSGWSLAKMKIRALLDFQQMAGLLLWARNRRLARWLLGKDRYRTYEFLRECEALVVKGGGYIYAYKGLRWNYFIGFGLFPLLLAQRCGVKVIILPNSFGPFETRWSRWLARRVLGRCSIVTTREVRSQKVLDGLVPGKARTFPDMAFGLEAADRQWAEAELGRLRVPVGDMRCVGITMRPWRFPNVADPQQKYSQYIAAFAQLIGHLVARGYAPVLFAQVLGPHAHEDDRIALRDVAKVTSLGDRLVLVDGDYDCREVKAFYQFMEFMVCTRLHSAIFSIAQNVPCMTVSYQGHKATGIMEEIGLGDYCVDIAAVQTESLCRMFDRLVVDRDEVKRKMKGYMAACRRRLDELERLVASELVGVESDRPHIGSQS